MQHLEYTVHMPIRSMISAPPWRDARYTWDDVARIRVRRSYDGNYRVDPDLPKLPDFQTDPDWEGWADLDLYLNALPAGEKVRVELLNGVSETIHSQVIIMGESTNMANGNTPVIFSDVALAQALVSANESLRKLAEKAVSCNTEIVQGRDAGLRRSTAEAWQRVGAAETRVAFLEDKALQDGEIIRDLSSKVDQLSNSNWDSMPIPERIQLFREGVELLKGAFNPTQKAAEIFSEALLQSLEEGNIPEGLRGKIGNRTADQQKKIGIGGVKLIRASVAPGVWDSIIQELLCTVEHEG